MTRHTAAGPSSGRSLLILLAAALALAAVVAMPIAAGAKGGKAKPTLKVKASQAELVSKGKLKVQVKSKKTIKLQIGSKIDQDGQKTKFTASGKLKVKKGKKAKITLPLTADGKRLVQSCLDSKVLVTAKTTGKGKHSTFKKKVNLKRDPGRCDGTNPVGVDVNRADHCDPISKPGEQCLFPYPNDYYTRADSSTPTGKRLDLKTAAMPTNASGVPINPTDINTSDGFSPGAPIVLRVPGMDTTAAFAQTNPVPVTNMDASFDASQPIVLIDAATGERQLIWSELDSNATSPEQTVLEIHPGKNLKDGHRYIVALRDMKDASGSVLAPPEGFRLFRDDIPTGIPAIENRRAHFEQVFGELANAGIQRSNLYMAWDFTVASTENLTGRLLAMRNDAFAQLGDTNLTDNSIAGTTSPSFAINPGGVIDYPTPTGSGVEDIRQVTGTFQVPCYMKDPDGAGPLNPCDPGSTLNLNSNGVPQQNGMYTARFRCNIPRSAVTETSPGSGVFNVTNPARPSLYGHGLFGSYNETFSQNIRQLGTENNVVTCGTDFIGMASDDELAVALPALQDLSSFNKIPDRLQQGLLDFLYLGRLLIHPNGFASSPAFQFNGGTSAIDPSEVFYYGNSQGGIAGGALTAVATDITRSVLYVPGMTYATLLPRSVDFNNPDPTEVDFASALYPAYPIESTRPLALTLVQGMWDRGEPDGYANHMTTDPLPGTPAHKVLIVMAYGDHQVANVQTAVEARTIGAPLRMPAVDANRIPGQYVNLFPSLPTLGDLTGPAADGSGYFVWDIGPKRDNPATPNPNDFLGTDPPPITNTPPQGDLAGIDPHDTVIRSSPLTRAQIAAFIDTGGKITNPCGANPCYAAGWNGFP